MKLQELITEAKKVSAVDKNADALFQRLSVMLGSGISDALKRKMADSDGKLVYISSKRNYKITDKLLASMFLGLEIDLTAGYNADSAVIVNNSKYVQPNGKVIQVIIRYEYKKNRWNL